MNICLTMSVSPWSTLVGGGSIAVHNLARQLSEVGHRVFVVYTTLGQRAAVPEKVNYEIVWAKGIGEQQNIWRHIWRLLNIFTVASAVHKLASRTRIDIIHGNGYEATLLHFIARRHGSAFTMTIHRPYFPKLNSANVLVRPDILFRENICFLEWNTFRKARRVFAVSKFTKAHVVANLGLKAEKIEVVYNGFASEFFDVRRENISEGKVELVFHGRINPQKGIDTLLKSLALVVKQLNDRKRIHLTIVGTGPREQEYRELAQSLGLSQNVSFPGWLNVEQMAELFSEASLSVLPTRAESFALNIGEAMAAGIPTISTNIEPLLEIISDGKTGLLVPPENPEALAEKILYAISHPVEMEAIAQAGRRYVKENFTWEKVAERYCIVFESLLNSG